MSVGQELETTGWAKTLGGEQKDFERGGKGRVSRWETVEFAKRTNLRTAEGRRKKLLGEAVHFVRWVLYPYRGKKGSEHPG